MATSIRLAEILGALSRALDLTEGQPPGHCARCCWIGVNIGRRIGLPDDELRDLYYALLLKDLGCSSNAARICDLYLADDLQPGLPLLLTEGEFDALIAQQVNGQYEDLEPTWYNVTAFTQGFVTAEGVAAALSTGSQMVTVTGRLKSRTCHPRSSASRRPTPTPASPSWRPISPEFGSYPGRARCAKRERSAISPT